MASVLDIGSRPKGLPMLTLPPCAPLTVRTPEACRMTGIGRSKLYELIKAGEIETIKVGSSTLVTVAGLEAFLDKCRATDAAQRSA
jgi:excisionase family DNA binding protein